MKAGKTGTKRVDKTRDRRQSLPAGLSRVNLNASGIDVGASSHFVAVPEDRWEPPVREFDAYTADLYRLADWLAECGVETVSMESTTLDKIKNVHPSDTIATENSGTRGPSIWIPAGETRRVDKWLCHIRPESLVRAFSGGTRLTLTLRFF